jgi:hypothetical protein
MEAVMVSIRFTATTWLRALDWARRQGMQVSGCEAVWIGQATFASGMVALGCAMGLSVTAIVDTATGLDKRSEYAQDEAA